MGRFWEEKSLAQMNREEWESLCDGCARCCLIKLEDEDTNELFYTGVACRYLDRQRCRCTEYDSRTRLVPDCLQVSIDNVHDLYWMPQSCAYRLLAEGKALPDWHPLVSGDPDSVHTAGISVRGFAVSEATIESEEELEAYIIES